MSATWLQPKLVASKKNTDLNRGASKNYSNFKEAHDLVYFATTQVPQNAGFGRSTIWHGSKTDESNLLAYRTVILYTMEITKKFAREISAFNKPLIQQG